LVFRYAPDTHSLRRHAKQTRRSAKRQLTLPWQKSQYRFLYASVF
jgi:hypothetical protein